MGSPAHRNQGDRPVGREEVLVSFPTLPRGEQVRPVAGGRGSSSQWATHECMPSHGRALGTRVCTCPQVSPCPREHNIEYLIKTLRSREEEKAFYILVLLTALFLCFEQEPHIFSLRWALHIASPALTVLSVPTPHCTPNLSEKPHLSMGWSPAGGIFVGPADSDLRPATDPEGTALLGHARPNVTK